MFYLVMFLTLVQIARHFTFLVYCEFAKPTFKEYILILAVGLCFNILRK